MVLNIKLVAASLAALAGISVFCPLCVNGPSTVAAQQTVMPQQAPDTAIARLHISGMTCGSCPITARLALSRIPGVVDAKVTLRDSLGVVRYHPQKVSPSVIAAELLRLTGYRATVLADPPASAPRSAPEAGR